MAHQAFDQERGRRPRAGRTLNALNEAPSTEPLSQTPAAAHQRALADRRSSLPVPAAEDRAAYHAAEMKRGSEEKGTEQDAKKPKETAAPAPAPKKDEPPICNVGNLLEICDQDVDFAVELVGEGGQEMTGHAAKAVSRATSMDDAWLRAVRNQTLSAFNFWCVVVCVRCCSLDTVACLSEIVSEFELKTWPRCRDSLIDFHTGSRRSRRTRTPSRASPVI